MTTIVAYKNTLLTDTHLFSLETNPNEKKDISHLYEDQEIYPKMVELWGDHGWLDDRGEVKLKYGHKGFATKGTNVNIEGDIIRKIAVADNLIFLPALEMIMLADSGLCDEKKMTGFLNEFSQEVLDVAKRTIREGHMKEFDENLLPLIINSQFILIGDKYNYVIAPDRFDVLGNYVVHQYAKDKVIGCGSGWVALECQNDLTTMIDKNDHGEFIIFHGQPIDEYPDDNVNPEFAIYNELHDYILEASECDPMTNDIIKEVK